MPINTSTTLACESGSETSGVIEANEGDSTETCMHDEACTWEWRSKTSYHSYQSEDESEMAISPMRVTERPPQPALAVRPTR